MLNRSVLILLGLVIVVVIGAGIYAGSVQIKPTSQVGNTDVTTITNSNTPEINNQQNNSVKTMISSSEAQNIAQTYIEEPGATAGTPRLVEIDGQMVYVVPVLMDGDVVGQIEIDAYTGENVGGAGGVT
jgi:uncharacterized membrane protein YkoI